MIKTKGKASTRLWLTSPKQRAEGFQGSRQTGLRPKRREMRHKREQVLSSGAQTGQTQTTPWQSRNAVNGSSFPGGVGSFWETSHGAILLLSLEGCLENGARVLRSLLVRDAIHDLTTNLMTKSRTLFWSSCKLYLECFLTCFPSTQTSRQWDQQENWKCDTCCTFISVLRGRRPLASPRDVLS